MRSIFKKITNGRNAVITAGVIYTVMAVITVASAWIIDLHRFDLWLSISRYVALRPWTAMLYFFCVVAMAVIVIRYLRHTPMQRYRKVIYLLIIICVCGCAVFPCNREWSRTVTGIHNMFAYGLMIVGFLSFLTALVLESDKKLKRFGMIATAYAAFFILAYAIVRWRAFWMTMLIWENIFIYLFLIELWLESSKSHSESSISLLN